MKFLYLLLHYILGQPTKPKIIKEDNDSQIKFYSITDSKGKVSSVTETPYGYTIFNNEGTKEIYK